MKFSDSIKKFADKSKARIRQAQTEDSAKALAVMKVTLGEDFNLLIAIPNYDMDRGKFYNVQAPGSVVVKLREAGLLRE